MTDAEAGVSAPPADVEAIFHCTFHATRGNIVDWSRKTREDIPLDGVEFSSLPSGLHVVDEDVIYFTKDDFHGICVFRRRRTKEAGMRGVRLGAVGLLIAPSDNPRPWLHLPTLKRLSDDLEAHPEDRESLATYFESYKTRPDSPASVPWAGWQDELSRATPEHPLLQLPYLLQILGPATLTLLKFVLARQRVLIYTHPAVELACQLARAAAEMCFGDIRDREESAKGVSVLGLVGLVDIDKLKKESWKGDGWIACTTDAIFLEKGYLYDLVIDLSTSTTSRPFRPSFFIPRPVVKPNALPPASRAKSKTPLMMLQPVRFTFSDLRIWAEFDRILRADPSGLDPNPGTGSAPGAGVESSGLSSARWLETGRLYEDACMLYAGIWRSASWRWGAGGSGKIRLDGPDDDVASSTSATGMEDWVEVTLTKGQSQFSRRRVSGGSNSRSVKSGASGSSTLSCRAQTTVALLETFHAHVAFLEWRLEEFAGQGSLRDADPSSAPSAPSPASTSAPTTTAPTETPTETRKSKKQRPASPLPPLILSARDLIAFELGPLSELDAVFLESYAEKKTKRKCIVKRGWKEIVGALFGIC
ncbi:hypothetical protein BOTBODRAFT_59753 [Botryobasidium botryosum FD-172 SS1]|uniref:DUF4484 domain-containing protein n=1 Tax=Botryobasidium botryosum (strain FD-172 SS1) TaxID=930990 RepID=A0A067LXC5_BOTB1|nr:hypothetical protein BOTBODRAFT_59753 [Botryobasidium botryosum FD-172 SS1]